MKYILSGLELEYRDCQILRQAVREWGVDRNYLKQNKTEFHQYLSRMAEKEELLKSKRERIHKIIVMLEGMEDNYYLVLAAYLDHLAHQDSQINLMVPFDIEEVNLYIMPVNTHMLSTKEDNIDINRESEE